MTLWIKNDVPISTSINYRETAYYRYLVFTLPNVLPHISILLLYLRTIIINFKILNI